MTKPSSPHTRPAGPPPGPADLREAALAHVARFSTTEDGLRRVLERRISRWARRAEQEGAESADLAATVQCLAPLAASVAADMVRLGAVDDSSFARARASRLTRSGRSRRAVQAHLLARGLESDLLENCLDETLGTDERSHETELAAALVFARKRRAGPFGSGEEAAKEPRLLAAFARAGFSRDTALRALLMERDDAEIRILALRDAP